MTTVVNVLNKKADIFIGRANGKRGRFGNPFTHKKTGFEFIVPAANAEQSCQLFDAWLTGNDPDLFFSVVKRSWLDFQQERRFEILSNLRRLHGKSLGCFCVGPRNPDGPCHGFTLARLADTTAQVVDLKAERVACDWSLEQVKALGWLEGYDVYPCMVGWSIKPFGIERSTSVQCLQSIASFFGAACIKGDLTYIIDPKLEF